jgi:hypothetical protein
VDWIEGRLSEEEAQVVAEQVATADDATRADVAWLRAFARVSQATVLASPPPEVRAQLVRRFEAYAQDRRPPGFLSRLVATLTFDSYRQAGTVGVRGLSLPVPPQGWEREKAGGVGGGNAPPSERQLIYITEVTDVVVHVWAHAQSRHVDVHGQVLPSADVTPDVFTVQLLGDTGEVGITTSDDLGEFTFEELVPGVYEMVVSTEQFEVLITPVELHL